jgi:UDP-glucose 4-epimerase
VFDNLEKGHSLAVQGVPLIRGDLRCAGDVGAAFDQAPIEAVMHFSAYSLVGESMQRPERYYENNMLGTLNLITAMKDRGIKHFIFSSTAATFGEPERVPIDEDHPTCPTNVYGETKLAVERMLDWFDRIYALRSVRLRYFNAAGAHPAGDIGELHDPETHLIPLVLATALGRRDHIDIYGDDYDTFDGTCVRDYIHVCDLADAHILALRHLQQGGGSGVFNLGNGSGHSVKQIIDLARDITGRAIPVRIVARRAGDPAILIAGSEKACRLLGWKPALHDIRTIIETAWAWHSGKALEWEALEQAYGRRQTADG